MLTQQAMLKTDADAENAPKYHVRKQSMWNAVTRGHAGNNKCAGAAAKGRNEAWISTEPLEALDLARAQRPVGAEG